MYESHKQAPLAPAAFARRLSAHVLAALALLLVSMGAGMLLGGMGPVHLPVTTGGKLFAGFYALYAGLVFIASAALIFTPIVHRVMHSLHWSERL